MKSWAFISNFIWKFICSLLEDSDFKQLVIDEIAVRKFSSLGNWWDDFKARIRKLSINFSSRKHRDANAERRSLTSRLIRAKNSLYSGDQSFVPIVSKQAEGVKIRSRAQFIEEGEKPTRFFFRLEQTLAEKKTLNLLLIRTVSKNLRKRT